MSRYSCQCPAPGCSFILTVTAKSWDEAFKKMYAGGSQHIVENHPDFPEFENAEEKAREFATKKMVCN